MELLIHEDEKDESGAAGNNAVPGEQVSLAPAMAPFPADFPAWMAHTGADQDSSNDFTPADSWPQARAWIELLARVRRGELQP